MHQCNNVKGPVRNVSMSIQKPDDPQIETIVQSACARPNATVAPARRQWDNETEGWVVTVS